jgi:hypothetical protein
MRFLIIIEFCALDERSGNSGRLVGYPYFADYGRFARQSGTIDDPGANSWCRPRTCKLTRPSILYDFQKRRAGGALRAGSRAALRWHDLSAETRPNCSHVQEWKIQRRGIWQSLLEKLNKVSVWVFHQEVSLLRSRVRVHPSNVNLQNL